MSQKLEIPQGYHATFSSNATLEKQVFCVNTPHELRDYARRSTGAGSQESTPLARDISKNISNVESTEGSPLDTIGNDSLDKRRKQYLYSGSQDDSKDDLNESAHGYYTHDWDETPNSQDERYDDLGDN